MSESVKERKRAKNKAYREANREKAAAYQKAWREVNRVKHLTLMKDWRKANSDKKAALDKAYRIDNREKYAAYQKAWREANPDRATAIEAKRRAQKLQATPKWMTAADFAAIQEWYQIAKELQWLSEEPLHVDHIIPLQGKDVCGLHIAANLQILPASMNITKGNKLNV